ncbi:hypothetical protein NBRC10512_002418 [Rhodotorula toruloides]|uniref:RHTO0S03e05820g1_1 n=2 Tax=Rhodotorula toruloides TaxID=5286 RepID=A0A061ATZ6_RHOTO|nr:uncharacterized protein RHTO_00292 [Rhodotorula toruloides NP11]EMS25864.1 hypothetical protein RHTO_00292 [Rhodotorula toruloides NP11]CDR38207.1 RHTO0S03e05820g1_1 [Rhodotorula toruloides]
MLLTLYHAASLLLASAASAIPLVRRSANGALAIWDDTPGPTCFSTANYSCDSKDLRAVASAFPVNLAIIAYPYPANISQQTVLGSGGNYSAKPGYPFEISWNVTDLDGQLHAYRLMDAGGEAAHSVLPGYTVPPDYCQYPHDQQMCWHVGSNDTGYRVVAGIMYTLLGLLGVCILFIAITAPLECWRKEAKRQAASRISPAAPTNPSLDPPAIPLDSTSSVETGQTESLPDSSDVASSAASSTLASFKVRHPRRLLPWFV